MSSVILRQNQPIRQMGRRPPSVVVKQINGGGGKKKSIFSWFQLSPVARQRLYKFLIAVLVVAVIVGIILLVSFLNTFSSPTPIPLLSTGSPSASSFAEESSTGESTSTDTSSSSNATELSALCNPSSTWISSVEYTTISEDPTLKEIIPLKMFVLPTPTSDVIGIVGMFTITKPVRTFQIHIYLKNIQLSNNGEMLWGWNNNNVSSSVFPSVTFNDVSYNVTNDTSAVSCSRYMVTELDTISPPASLYVYFSLNVIDTSSTGSFAVMVFQDTLSPLSYLSSFSPSTAIPLLSSEEMTSFCIQST